MDGGAAEHAVALAEGGLDGVECDRSDNGDGHGARPYAGRADLSTRAVRGEWPLPL